MFSFHNWKHREVTEITHDHQQPNRTTGFNPAIKSLILRRHLSSCILAVHLHNNRMVWLKKDTVTNIAKTLDTCVTLDQSELTQRVGGRALKDNPVGGQEDGPLGRKQGRTAHRTCGFLSPVCYEVYPHSLHHKLFTGQKRRP